MRSILRKLIEPLRKNGKFDVATALAKGRILRTRYCRDAPSWLVTNANDEIQRYQSSSGYYEVDELTQLKRDVGERFSVLDVGANIGNHSIFFMKEMGCRALIAVEPYPETYRHLLANLALNVRGDVDIRLVTAALGANSGTAMLIPPSEFNVGLTRVDTATQGSTLLMTGDALVGNTRIDLIKIDVEGMEYDVLLGLSSVLKIQRPALYVEVSSDKRNSILELMELARYRVIRETNAYETQSNFTFLPA